MDASLEDLYSFGFLDPREEPQKLGSVATICGNGCVWLLQQVLDECNSTISSRAQHSVGVGIRHTPRRLFWEKAAD